MTFGGMKKSESNQGRKAGILSNRHASFRFVAIIFIGTLIVVACVVVGPSFTDWLAYFLRTGSIAMCRDITSTSPQEIESFVHIKFSPSSAKAMMYAPEGCTSPRHFFVRFELDPHDLNPFVASTRVTALRSQGVRPTSFALIPDRLGWHLDSVPLGLVGSSPISTDYQQTIGVDISDPNRYIVYVAVASYD